jgi:alpha/beta superfamily hydrolase
MTIEIDGPAGPLEASYDPGRTPTGRQAVLCHPHPQYGGNMHDAVLDTLARALISVGCGVLRFNFRGVGSSAGSYDQGRGEIEDLLAAAQWLREEHPQGELWLGGYSFGAWVTWRALAGPLGASRVILIAPPIGPMPFEPGAGDIPVHVVVGSEDDFIDPAALATWSGVTVHTIDGADHFFTGLHQPLQDCLTGLLTDT